MTGIRGVVRYRCPCGAAYLVATGDATDEAWLQTLAVVAQSLGTRLVNASQSSFICDECGREHVNDDAAQPSDLPSET